MKAVDFSAGLHEATFRAPRGLRNRHVQTLLPRLLARPRLATEVEIVELPDGDFVELASVQPGPIDADAPIFVLFHGLEGSIDAPYARELLHVAASRGWRSLLMHFRGCGRYPNRLPRAYHSGDTADAGWVIEHHLGTRFGEAPIVAAGISLGANMLVKLVAERGGAARRLAGAIAVNAPLDLAACANTLDRAGARFYQWYLLHGLRRKVARRVHQRELPLDLDGAALRRLRTFWAYDDAVTAPLHGFASAADYYRQASAGPLLREIETPTLILHAADDPFMPPELFSRLPPPSSSVRVEVATHGGHVGYIECRDGRLRSWLGWRVGAQLDHWRPRPGVARG